MYSLLNLLILKSLNNMKYDIIIIGSGPGGYVTGIRASQLGFKVAIVEKENLGGICLNWGCIPTKALLKSAQVYDYLKHVDEYGLKAEAIDKDFEAVIKRSRGVADGMSKGVAFLMKKNKIDIINGFGKIKTGKKVDVTAEDGTVTEYSATNIIIATGARSRELPNLPQDGKKVIGYRQAMSLTTQPKSMIVVGSGAIGVEFAHFYNSMGTEVTIVEFMPNVVPVEDVDVSKQFEKSIKKADTNLIKSKLEALNYTDYIPRIAKTFLYSTTTWDIFLIQEKHRSQKNIKRLFEFVAHLEPELIEIITRLDSCSYYISLVFVNRYTDDMCSGLIVPDTSISFSYYVTRGEYEYEKYT